MSDTLNSPLQNPLMVSLQLTSVCNLRCIYCPQHDGQYKGTPMTREFADDIIGYISENDAIESISVGFFGETLCYKGWEEHLDRLLEAGKRMDICSNFQHVLNDRQVDVLSRFSTIQFSIDTIDINLLKEVRPPADIRQIVHNMHLIRGRAIEMGRTIPQMSWNCTLTNKVVNQIPALAGYAASCCVPSLNFNELVYYDKGDPTTLSIFDLNGDEFLDAHTAVQNVRKLAVEYDMQIRFAADHWLDQLEAKKIRVEKQIAEGVVNNTVSTEGAAMIQGAGGFSSEFGLKVVRKGQTRLCLEPWRNLYVMPTGDIYTCCTRGDSMGVIANRAEIEEVRNNEQYQDLRNQLLTGNVTDDTCRHCSLKPIATPEELQKAVAQLLAQG